MFGPHVYTLLTFYGLRKPFKSQILVKLKTCILQRPCKKFARIATSSGEQTSITRGSVTYQSSRNLHSDLQTIPIWHPKKARPFSAVALMPAQKNRADVSVGFYSKDPTSSRLASTRSSGNKVWAPCIYPFNVLRAQKAI